MPAPGGARGGEDGEEPDGRGARTVSVVMTRSACQNPSRHEGQVAHDQLPHNPTVSVGWLNVVAPAIVVLPAPGAATPEWRHTRLPAV